MNSWRVTSRKKRYPHNDDNKLQKQNIKMYSGHMV
jgi:hypothetical protein